MSTESTNHPPEPAVASSDLLGLAEKQLLAIAHLSKALSTTAAQIAPIYGKSPAIAKITVNRDRVLLLALAEHMDGRDMLTAEDDWIAEIVEEGRRLLCPNDKVMREGASEK